MEREWRLRRAAYMSAHPALAMEWERVMWGDLREGWDKALPSFSPGTGPMATRKASGKVINAIARRVPELAGGSADLAPSTETLSEGGGEFLPDASPGGRNVPVGGRARGRGGA